MGKTSIGILAGLAGVAAGIVLAGITAEEVYECDVVDQTTNKVEEYRGGGAAGGYVTEDDRQEAREYRKETEEEYED